LTSCKPAKFTPLTTRPSRTSKLNFAGLQDVNDPVTLARFYNEQGADELVFYDITASAEERGLFTDILNLLKYQ
jgi:cyclase